MLTASSWLPRALEGFPAHDTVAWHCCLSIIRICSTTTLPRSARLSVAEASTGSDLHVARAAHSLTTSSAATARVVVRTGIHAGSTIADTVVACDHIPRVRECRVKFRCGTVRITSIGGRCIVGSVPVGTTGLRRHCEDENTCGAKTLQPNHPATHRQPPDRTIGGSGPEFHAAARPPHERVATLGQQRYFWISSMR
jgi:hypothetical protein